MKQWVPLIAAVGSLLWSIAYLVQGRQYPALMNRLPGPGLFPLTIGLFWLAMSLWAIVEAWHDGPAKGLAIEWTDKVGWIRIGIVLVSAAMFIILLDLLGDLVVTFLALTVVMRAMGMKKLVPLIGTSVGMALICHFLFVNQLGVPLPQGFWTE